jgi:hypothetical protein
VTSKKSRDAKNNNLSVIITIIVALIGCGGAIFLGYATFFGPIFATLISRISPNVITPIPDSQPTAISVSGCTELSSMSLSDEPKEYNFENKQERFWSAIDDGTGNTVFQANTSEEGADIRFGPEFSNGCIEYRFKLLDFDTQKNENSGKIEFNFRILEKSEQNPVEQGYVLAFIPILDRAGLLYRTDNGSDWEDLKCGQKVCRSDPLNFENNKNKWFYVTVDVQGANINVFLRVENQNDLKWKNIFSSQDSRLKEGIFALGVGPYTIVHFDDIKVWDSKP